MTKLWKIGTSIDSYINEVIENSMKHGYSLQVKHEGDKIALIYPDGYREYKQKNTATQFLRVVMSLGIVDAYWTSFEKEKSVIREDTYEIIPLNHGEKIGDFIGLKLIDRCIAIYENQEPLFPSEESLVFSLLATYFAKQGEDKKRLINSRLQSQSIIEVEKWYSKTVGWINESEPTIKEKINNETAKYILGISKDVEKIVKTISSVPSRKVEKYISEKNLTEQLHATAFTFGMFFEEYFVKSRSIVIPVYQRKYIWPKATVRVLLNDIKNAKSSQTHYVGNIVAKISTVNAMQEIKVIDGQQRLTTLTIIARALYDYTKFKELPVEKVVNDKFIIEEDENIITRSFNRVKGNEDYDAFKYVMKGLDDSSKKKISTSSNIVENYKEVLNWLAENIVSENEVIEFWKSLFNAITFVLIDAKASEEYKLFEKLNTGSIPLTTLELFKNYVIDAFSKRGSSDEESQQAFTDFIDKKFDKKSQKVEIEKFISSYIRVENSIIGSDTVFNQFKNLIEQKFIINNPYSTLNDVLESLGEEIDLYNEISKYSKYNSSESYTKYYKDFLYMFDGRNVYFPLIIRLIKMCFEDYKNPTVSEANKLRQYLRILEIFEVRLQVAIYRGQSLSTKIEQLLVEISDDTTPSEFWKMVTKGGKSSLASVDQLKDALESKSIANKPARLILTRLENYFALPKKWDIDKEPTFVAMYNNPSQREHLLPTEWRTKWKEYLTEKTNLSGTQLEEYVNKYINYIGNAFPIPEWSNKEVQNASIFNKVREFEKAQYLVPLKTFNGIKDKLNAVDVNNFTPEEIINRSKQIAEIAAEIWADYE